MQAAPKARIEIVTPKVSKTKLGLGAIEHSFSVQFNPKEYSITKSAEWKAHPAKAAKKGATPEFTGPNARQMTVELFLDDTEKGASPAPDLLQKLEWLYGCCGVSEKTKENQKPSAPLLVFRWGQLVFAGGVKSVNVKYTLFNEKGDPLRATCALTIQEVTTDPPPAQNPTSGAEERYKSRRLVAGETLASIAYEEFDDPTLWRRLAEANGIDDPLRVREGIELLVPAIHASELT